MAYGSGSGARPAGRGRTKEGGTDRGAALSTFRARLGGRSAQDHSGRTTAHARGRATTTVTMVNWRIDLLR
jgi:hypothetical protein